MVRRTASTRVVKRLPRRLPVGPADYDHCHAANCQVFARSQHDVSLSLDCLAAGGPQGPARVGVRSTCLSSLSQGRKGQAPVCPLYHKAGKVRHLSVLFITRSERSVKPASGSRTAVLLTSLRDSQRASALLTYVYTTTLSAKYSPCLSIIGVLECDKRV